MTKPIIFSGIQPSGDLNIGHYIGAIKNWARLQHDYDSLFCIVDLHALTTRHDPKIFHERCYDCLAAYLALGLDPNKNLLFLQSHIPQHTQLAWILNCFTQVGELNRMTQFKDKSKRNAGNVNVGLFAYPVLMAADILLYNTNLVPVGEDQKQHVEITRDIAERFNNIYGNVFTIPEGYFPPMGARIMSLLEPTKKMSKTDPNPNNNINILDPPETISAKVKRAVTDSGNEIRMDEAKPGVANLLTIFASVTNKTIAQLESEYQSQNAGYGKFKNDLAEALVAFLAPVQKHYQELRQDQKNLDATLERGAAAARIRAQKTLDKVHDALGLVKI
jgi:tryptophanyl-tRNA synthetase